MQCMTHDIRPVRRWARKAPSDTDIRGDAVASYEMCREVLCVGFVPSARSLTPTDSGSGEGAVLQRAFLSYRHDFQPGDRMGPDGADAPDMEVFVVADFPTGQNLEVRRL